MSKHSTRNPGFSLRRILLQTVGINEGNRKTLNDAECGETGFENNDKSKGGVRPANSNSLCEKSTVENPELLDENICNICFLNETQENPFFTLNLCQHKFCITCLNRYLKNEISESRTDIACPQCSSAIHPNNIDCLLHDYPEIKLKYEDFMIRRYLVTDPDSRWCPAPDCSYAVIATGCASCPQLQCERKTCGTSFCYHCKALWHPDQTCDAARNSRQKSQHVPSNSFNSDPTRRDEIKPCPRCQVLIVKMNDGSCNHMSCSLCGAEFCWLCMKEVSDLHYLSPSGCTFWGKKPWSRKKKIVWQIGTLIGAPVGIALLAGIAVPLIVIGIPVWAGRKLLNRYKSTSKKKRNMSVAVGVIASILISPILAGLAIAIGVPILLFYVYGIVPVSLFRAGCANANNENFKYDDNIADRNANTFNSDSASIGAGSRLGETSLGDVSVSAVSGSIIDMTHNYAIRANQHSCRESTTALAGSVENHKIDSTDTSLSKSTTAVTCNSIKKSCSVDTSSAIALAGSISSKQVHLKRTSYFGV